MIFLITRAISYKLLSRQNTVLADVNQSDSLTFVDSSKPRHGNALIDVRENLLLRHKDFALTVDHENCQLFKRAKSSKLLPYLILRSLRVSRKAPPLISASSFASVPKLGARLICEKKRQNQSEWDGAPQIVQGRDKEGWTQRAQHQQSVKFSPFAPKKVVNLW